MEKHLLYGNEAIARGAYEAGVKVCSAYPGTPSTEVFENLPKYGDDLYCEWAPNEKVAVEVAYGASIAGVRSLAAMKHVGVNVAADPIFTAAYNGVNGGFVIISADDPSMHSSQNEQDRSGTTKNNPVSRMSRTTGTMQRPPKLPWWSRRILRSALISCVPHTTYPSASTCLYCSGLPPE